MKLLTHSILFCVFLYGTCKAQDKNLPARFSHSQSILLEAGGTGVFYSLNYELIFFNTPRYKTALDAGINYIGWDIVSPVSLNEIISFGKNHLEIGAGYTFASYISQRFTARIGYRYQKPEGRFVFRLGFTPWLIYSKYFLEPDKTYEFKPWAGIACGFSF